METIVEHKIQYLIIKLSDQLIYQGLILVTKKGASPTLNYSARFKECCKRKHIEVWSYKLTTNHLNLTGNDDSALVDAV